MPMFRRLLCLLVLASHLLALPAAAGAAPHCRHGDVAASERGTHAGMDHAAMGHGAMDHAGMDHDPAAGPAPAPDCDCGCGCPGGDCATAAQPALALLRFASTDLARLGSAPPTVGTRNTHPPYQQPRLRPPAPALHA